MYFIRKNEEIADKSFKYTTISLIYKFKCIAAFSVYFILIVFLFWKCSIVPKLKLYLKIVYLL